jgi:hypothetical protein
MKAKNLDSFCSVGLRCLVLAFLLLGLATAGYGSGPVVPVPGADLERLTGSYRNAEMGVTFKVDLQGGHLVLNFTEGAPFKDDVLIPISSVRFRVEGEGLAPGLQVSFQLPEGGGKAESVTVIQPGLPIVLMTRVN